MLLDRNIHQSIHRFSQTTKLFKISNFCQIQEILSVLWNHGFVLELEVEYVSYLSNGNKSALSEPLILEIN